MNKNLFRVIFNSARGLWFVGAPFAKPAGYRTARVTAGSNLNTSF